MYPGEMVEAPRPNYGIDAPDVVRNLAVSGVVLLLAGAFFGSGLKIGPVRIDWESFLFPGVALSLTALLMVTGSKVGKLRYRDRLIASLGLRGGERVLDVGCGSGLLLIGVAKHLTSGKSVGIDLWQTVDQSGNCVDRTLQNARIEGVENLIEVETGDMRKMPFADAEFDVAVSCAAIHNIKTKAGRAEAIREIARVLKPGAKVVIGDIGPVKEYIAEFKRLGFADVQKSKPSFLFVIPAWTVTARKLGAPPEDPDGVSK